MARGRLVRHDEDEDLPPSRGPLIKYDPDTGEVEVVAPRRSSMADITLSVDGHPASPGAGPYSTGASSNPGAVEDPLDIEEGRLAQAGAPLLPPWGLLMLIVLSVVAAAVGVVLWQSRRRRRQRLRQRQGPPEAEQHAHEEAIATTGLTIVPTLEPVLRSVGLWGPAGLAALSERAVEERAALDAALLADDAAGARAAVGGLAALVAAVPPWVREALGPLQEEEAAVMDAERWRERLLRELEEATEAGEDALFLLSAASTAATTAATAEENGVSQAPNGPSSPLTLSASGSVSASASGSASVARLRAGSMEEPELRLIAAVARAREAMRGSGSGRRERLGQASSREEGQGGQGGQGQIGPEDRATGEGLRALLEAAETALASIQEVRDRQVERQIENLRAACTAAPHQHPPPRPQPQQQQQPRVEEVDEEGRSATTPSSREAPLLLGAEAASQPAATEGPNAQPAGPDGSGSDRGESKGALVLSSTSSEALTTTTTTTASSTAVVVAAGGGGAQQQDQAALFNHISQSFHMSTMLSAMAGRLGKLEEKLERQRETRAAHGTREAGAARQEAEARRVQLRGRTKELAAARGARDATRRAAEEARRLQDQAVLTYLLPVSFLAFGAGVLLATSDDQGHPSAFLVDALWRVPLHDLVYGTCARRAAKAAAAKAAAGASASAAVKVVVHEPRRIAGATAAGGEGKGGGAAAGWPILLQWAAAALLPSGGAVEMSACYVRHTVYLVLGLVAAALLHHLMGGLGLSQHRAKLHVAMLAYAFQRHILRVTWRSLRSLRHLLALHALLWLASLALDAGHAFAHRRALLRGAVPALLLAVALYDAALYVDAKQPWQMVLLMLHRGLEACVSSSGDGDGDGGGGEL